jgi:hypothetical protein
MHLIETEGLVLIGPGSEWFWAAASGVVTAVTFLLIYRQVRLQGAANSLARITVLERDWESRHMTMLRVEAAQELRTGIRGDGTDAACRRLLSFLADVTSLWRRGLLDDEEAGPTWALSGWIWYQLLGPVIDAERQMQGASTYSDADWLMTRVRSLTTRRRDRWELDLPVIETDEDRARWLDSAIARNLAAVDLMDRIDKPTS